METKRMIGQANSVGTVSGDLLKMKNEGKGRVKDAFKHLT